MRQRRAFVLQFLNRVIESIFNDRVAEFRKQHNLEYSWFNVRSEQYMAADDDFFSDHETFSSTNFAVTRFKIVDFGSTRLDVESATSDLDLLVTTFDCLYERVQFFQKLEANMK